MMFLSLPVASSEKHAFGTICLVALVADRRAASLIIVKSVERGNDGCLVVVVVVGKKQKFSLDGVPKLTSAEPNFCIPNPYGVL